MTARSVSFVMTVLLAATVVHGAPPTSEQVILERVPHGGIQPQVQAGTDGEVHLLYYTGDARAGDVFFVRRPTGQTDFSEPLRVNSQTGSVIAAGSIRGAQLAVAGDRTVHVTWNGSQHAKPTGPHGELPLLYTRLLPDAAEFEPQKNLISNAYGLDGGGCVAADSAGNVYVAWHAGEGQEDSRRVWLLRSSDNGETFTGEQPIDSERVGACGCCDMSGTVAPDGNAMFLYRSAREDVHRDMYLLTSSGDEFKSTTLHDWTVGACPMSSAAFAHSGHRTWAAWETDGQIYLHELLDAAADTSRRSAPGRPNDRKHPRVAVNQDGELLLVWTEGTGWQRGGSLAWQIYDAHGRTLGKMGSAPGVPAWSFAAAYARPDGSFVILY